MKKVLSLTLAALMVVSMVPTAFAADVDYQNGTEVEYTGSRTTVNADGTETHNAEYTITVPALLAPGGSGTVTLQGMWPSDATVKVTAEDKVEMVNNINSADKKTLAVTFTAIELAGNNTVAVSDDETVSVADISNALFGTWSGKFNYNVEYNGEAGGSGTVTPTPDPEQPTDPDDGGDDPVVLNGSATFSKYLANPGCHTANHEESCYIVEAATLTWEELQIEENGAKYGYDASSVDFLVQGTQKHEMSNCAFMGCKTLTSITIPNYITRIGVQTFYNCTNLTTINYAGTMEQWADIELGQNWNKYVTVTEVICSDGTVALS